jgi:hypothetical protein
MSSNNGNKKGAKRLTEQNRLEIITKLSRPNPPSKRSLAREYNVDEKAVRQIWSKKDEIEQRSALMTNEARAKVFRQCKGQFPQIEDQLFTWIDAMRRANLTVAPSLAIEKAKQIAAALSIPEDDFKASWQWLQKFRARKGLQEVLLHGEGGEVDKNNPALLAQLDALYDIIKEYDPEQVYNMDETGLFYRQLPQYSLLMPNEDVSTVRGKKKIKDRVTLVVCANATGSHKISCALIGKAKSPACIKNRAWPVPYFSQNKAWMDKETCWKWFHEVFVPEVRRRTGRRVLLIMDNAPGHFEAFEEGNIRVVFFPPNVTSWKQPCDQGIIAALKKRVKYLYLRDVMDYYDQDEAQKEHKRAQAQRLPRGSAGAAFGNPAHLLDAANYVKRAWDAITSTTISNAWKKAEIIPTLVQDDSEEEDAEELSDGLVDELLQRLSNVNITEQEINEFIDCDNEDSIEYIEAIMEDVQGLVNSEAIENPNIESSVDETEASRSSIEEQVRFVGFHDLYEKILAVEDQIICEEFENGAGKDYDRIVSSFSVFQGHLRHLTNKVKERRVARMRQSTLHDAWN